MNIQTPVKVLGGKMLDLIASRLKMPCGKYKNVLVSEVMETDPAYICWVISECKTGSLGYLANILKGEKPTFFKRKKSRKKRGNNV